MLLDLRTCTVFLPDGLVPHHRLKLLRRPLKYRWSSNLAPPLLLPISRAFRCRWISMFVLRSEWHNSLSCAFVLKNRPIDARFEARRMIAIKTGRFQHSVLPRKYLRSLKLTTWSLWHSLNAVPMRENALALALDLFIFRKITESAWNRAIHLISPTDLHYEDSNLRNCLLQSPAYSIPSVFIHLIRRREECTSRKKWSHQSIDLHGFDRDSELSTGSYRDQTDTS